MATGLDLLHTAVLLLAPWPFKLIIDGVLSNSSDANTETSKAFVQSWLGWATPGVQVLTLCGLMIILAAVSNYLAYKGGTLAISIGLKAVVGLRAHLYEALQYLPLKYHDNTRSSDSTYRVAYDAQAIQTIYNGVFSPVISSLLTLIGSLIIMLKLNLWLAVTSVGVVPAIAWSIRYYSRRIGKYSIQHTEAESILLGVAQEVLSSIKLVQAHSKERHELQRFIDSAEHSRHWNYKLSRMQMESSIVTTFIMSVATTVLYFIGSIQVLSQKLSIGGILVFVAYLSQLYRPIETLSGIAGTMAGVSAGLVRSFEIIDEYSSIEHHGAQPAIDVRSGRIDFRGVSFGYQSHSKILSNFSLSVQPGETVAIVGQTGEGKSTILSLLCKFYSPSEGIITIDGQDIRDCSADSIRQITSLVLQDTVLFSTSIAENIRYGKPNANMEEVIVAAKRADAMGFISKLPHGFDSQIGERGSRLSGGQRQRIAIARAFLRDTPILLLDEPTSALDPLTEKNITDSMYELMKNRTTILVTHRFGLAERADRVAVLKDGEIAEVGSPRELRERKGLYATLLRGGEKIQAILPNPES